MIETADSRINLRNYMKTKIPKFSPVQAKPVLLTALLLFLCGAMAHAQMTITSGTKVQVVSSSYLNSSESVVINSGGTLNVQGTLILNKNLQNQNVGANAVGPGTLLFSGSALQSIIGQNIIQNLNLNNASGLQLIDNTTVNGILTFSSGHILLGAANLRLGASQTFSGVPTSTKMIVPTGSGEVQKEFAGPGTFTFPVGDATATAEYSPVVLTFNSGTFSAGSYVGLNLVDAQFPGTAVSYLTRYWRMSQSGITNFSANATFNYLTADVVGTEANIFTTKVDVVPWVTYNAAITAANTIDAQGLGVFGTFTGNLGNAAVPPAVRSLQNKIIGAGVTACADATQTLIIAGNGTTYVVQNTGSVTHIAGTNIKYLPGTSVNPGGYLHGYISTTYCGPYIHPVPPSKIAGEGDEAAPSLQSRSGMFKIYPNPTTGKFTLELKGDVDPATVKVEIMGILGDRILSRSSVDGMKQDFSLSDRPTGVYMIHVTSGNISETQKIIKQ